MKQDSHKNLLKHWWAERWPVPAPVIQPDEPQTPVAAKAAPVSNAAVRQGSAPQQEPIRSRGLELSAEGEQITPADLAEVLPDVRALIKKRRSAKEAAAQTVKAKP